jgi:dipeptide/tripeptide permease
MSAGYVLVGLSETCSLILLGLIVAGVGTGLLLPNLNMWLAA